MDGWMEQRQKHFRFGICAIGHRVIFKTDGITAFCLDYLYFTMRRPRNFASFSISFLTFFINEIASLSNTVARGLHAMR
jgi:hypothetical protein